MSEQVLFTILLQLVGVGVIMAEIILPSMGLLSILALGVFGYSLYLAFTGISPAAGYALVAADVILVPVLVLTGLKLLAKSPVTLRKTLSKDAGVSSQDSALGSYLKMQGTAATDLRPAGMAILNGKRVDVVTRGEYIEKGVEIVVTAVTGNQIIVRPTQEL